MFEFFASKPKKPKTSSVESVKPRTEDPLTERREVTVRRSNGKLEDGFVITSVRDDGKVVVMKPLPELQDKVTTKVVNLRELEELNPPRGK